MGLGVVDDADEHVPGGAGIHRPLRHRQADPRVGEGEPGPLAGHRTPTVEQAARVSLGLSLLLLVVMVVMMMWWWTVAAVVVVVAHVSRGRAAAGRQHPDGAAVKGAG